MEECFLAFYPFRQREEGEGMIHEKEHLELLIGSEHSPSSPEVHLCRKEGARLIRNINENCSSERIDWANGMLDREMDWA